MKNSDKYKSLDILIVESDRVISEVLSAFFLDIGVQSVHSVTDFVQAMQMNNLNEYDIIFVDWSLTAYCQEFFDKLCRLEKDNMPFVVVCPGEGSASFNVTFRIGSFLFKPFEISDVKEILEKAIA